MSISYITQSVIATAMIVKMGDYETRGDFFRKGSSLSTLVMIVSILGMIFIGIGDDIETSTHTHRYYWLLLTLACVSMLSITKSITGPKIAILLCGWLTFLTWNYVSSDSSTFSQFPIFLTLCLMLSTNAVSKKLRNRFSILAIFSGLAVCSVIFALSHSGDAVEHSLALGYALVLSTVHPVLITLPLMHTMLKEKPSVNFENKGVDYAMKTRSILRHGNIEEYVDEDRWDDNDDDGYQCVSACLHDKDSEKDEKFIAMVYDTEDLEKHQTNLNRAKALDSDDIDPANCTNAEFCKHVHMNVLGGARSKCKMCYKDGCGMHGAGDSNYSGERRCDRIMNSRGNSKYTCYVTNHRDLLSRLMEMYQASKVDAESLPSRNSRWFDLQ